MMTEVKAYVPEDVRRKLKALCEVMHDSQSRFIRHCIDEAVRKAIESGGPDLAERVRAAMGSDSEARYLAARPRPKPHLNSRKRAYRDFLRSRAWREQRARVLARDERRCFVTGCEELATEAHHESYRDPIESTPDECIKASCSAHNRMERDNRVAFGRAHA